MGNKHPDTYYSRTLDYDVERPALEQKIDTDVCVIGGGLAGLAVALGLIERGKKVVLLEGRRLGHGASGRNGGFVLAGFAAGMDEVVSKTGLQHARELFNLTRDAQTKIKSRIKTYNISCDLQNGHLRASWFNSPRTLEKSAEFMHSSFSLPVEFWTREKVREVCITNRYHEGLFYPDFFHMHPMNYIMGLARVIEGRGGKIFESSMAAAVNQNSSCYTVATEKGSVSADHVVFCGSAYFNGLETKLSRSCLPVSTYVMNTEPLTKETLASAITKPYAIRDDRWTDDYYRILPDNSILWGGRVGLGRSVPSALPEKMRADLLKIYPQLSTVQVRCAWAGVMGYTVHAMPHIGQFKPGLWYCTNFGGNGVGPTTAGGEVIAAAIAQNDEKYKLFEPFGFAWTAGKLGPYIAKAAYFSWGLRDKAKELLRL